MLSSIQENVKRRYDLCHIYGPEAFIQCCCCPIRTLRRDILPRFVKSTIYESFQTNYNNEVHSNFDNFTKQTLIQLLPKNNWFEHLIDTYSNDHTFQLIEILNNGILFYEFLIYLRNLFSSENLLCVRMIDIYEELYNDNQIDEAISHAWKIYKLFIATGSIYEISLSNINRKDVMLNMANPTITLFDSAKKSAMISLRSNFEQYHKTNQYHELIYVLK